MRDPEFWFPLGEAPSWKGGRPKVSTRRSLEDFPPPTPQPTPCRLWQGAVDRYGYGVLSGRGKGTSFNHHARIRVHRWAWEQAHGPIPPGLVVRHKCDNRPCYRLTHLELGTVAENNADAAARNHLGPSRAIPPSEVRAIWARRQAGETWKVIAADYPQYSLATVKRVKDYISECELTDSPTEPSTTAPMPRAAGAEGAPSPTTRPGVAGQDEPSSSQPPTTTGS